MLQIVANAGSHGHTCIYTNNGGATQHRNRRAGVGAASVQGLNALSQHACCGAIYWLVATDN